MTSHILHVPERLSREDLAQLSDLLKSHGAKTEELEEGASSLLITEIENLRSFQNGLKRFSRSGVYLIHDSESRDSTNSRSKLRTHTSIKNSATQRGDNQAFTAKELASIYNITGTNTNRVNIAIIELGGGYKESDLTAYWDLIGLGSTRPIVQSVSIQRATNTPGVNNGADTEVALDIQVVGGVCPNSYIAVYFAPNTWSGFYNAVYSAITNTLTPFTTISISWGAPESYWPGNIRSAFENIFKYAANTKGINICVASGDSGASDGAPGLNVDYPASSPWAVACGGTQLVCPTKNYSDTGTSEVTWNDRSGAGGGGFSKFFARPTYQITALSKYRNNKRGVPDIAGDASPNTGWIILMNNKQYVIGGTSAVAPMVAGYLAGIEFKGFVNPVIYGSNAINFHDIVRGGNGGYAAGAKWDPVSGLGTPNGSSLTPSLVAKSSRARR